MSMSNHNSTNLDRDFRKKGRKLFLIFALCLISILSLSLLNIFNFNRVASYKTEGISTQIDVQDNYAFIACQDQGLEVVNISNPRTPIRISQFPIDIARSGNLVIYQNLAFIANYREGLEILNISNLNEINQIGHYNAELKDIFIKESIIYAIDINQGLLILNISDPTDPQLISRFSEGEKGYSIFVVEPYAYYVTNYCLKIVDISNKSQPFKVGEWSEHMQGLLKFEAEDVEVTGNYAFLADSTYGISVVDISKPTNPTHIESYEDEGIYNQVHIQGNELYAYDSNGAIKILDINNPQSLSKLREYKYSASKMKDYSPQTEYLYVVRNTGRLDIIKTWSSVDLIITYIIFTFIVGLTIISVFYGLLFWRWWRDKDEQPSRIISHLSQKVN